MNSSDNCICFLITGIIFVRGLGRLTTLLHVGEWRAHVKDGGGFDDGVAIVRCKERASTWSIALYESHAVRRTRPGRRRVANVVRYGGSRRRWKAHGSFATRLTEGSYTFYGLH